MGTGQPNVAAILNSRIDKRLINKTKLAQSAQIDPELLRRSLKGTRKLPADEFVRICNVLEMDIADFCSGEFLVPSNSSHVVDIRHQHDSTKLNITA